MSGKYVTKYRTAYRDAYRTKYRTKTQDTGYDLIPIIRPNFTYFNFTGLRPNTPHWLFFDGINVTQWVNTGYDSTEWNTIERNNSIRNPGDLYINSTAFPTELGGPTAASGPVQTNSNGEIDGLFYIQSNDSLSFPIGHRTLTAIDISVINRDDSLSVADTEYSAIGEYELYYEYEEAYQEMYQEEYQEAYQVWVPDPPPPPSPAPTPSPGGGSDDTYATYYNPADGYNYYAPTTHGGAHNWDPGHTPSAKNGTDNFKWPWQ